MAIDKHKKPERFAELNKKIGWEYKLKIEVDGAYKFVIVNYGRRYSSSLRSYGVGMHAVSALYHAQRTIVKGPLSAGRRESIDAEMESLRVTNSFHPLTPEDHLDIWLCGYQQYLETDYDRSSRDVLFHARISRALGDDTVATGRGKTFADAYQSLDEALRAHFEGDTTTPTTSSSNP